MFYYIDIFSPFKLHGSVPPLERISPAPFTNVDLGPFVPAEATCPSGQGKQEVRTSTRMGKTSLGSWGRSLIHTYHTFLSLVFLFSFFISFLCSQGSILKSHQQLS